MALIGLATVGTACGTSLPTGTVEPSVIPPSLTASASPSGLTPPLTPSPTPSATAGPTPTPVAIPTATPRPSYKPYPLVTVPIQAIQVSDDDGSRPAEITPDQVAWWVDRANEVYANAFIHFQYDPASDFATVRSSAVNDMVNWHEHPEASYALPSANRLAARYPGKLTVLFRHGAGFIGTGMAFSSSSDNFVAMTSYLPGPCGHVDSGFLAHEIGHYLGLAHTFAGPFPSMDEAERALRASNDAPTVFDGDGLADTAPDPFIEANRCANDSIVLDGIGFLLPRSNVMSYYADATDLSPQQIEIVRSILSFRIANGMALPTNADLQAPFEAESLVAMGTPPSACGGQDMTPYGVGRWSGDRQLTCWFSQVGDHVAVDLPAIEKSGRYALTAYLTQGQGYGTVQASLDGKPIGMPFNGDAPVPITPAAPFPLGTVSLARGKHVLEFTTVAPNPASNTLIFGIDALTLTP